MGVKWVLIGREEDAETSRRLAVPNIKEIGTAGVSVSH